MKSYLSFLLVSLNNSILTQAGQVDWTTIGFLPHTNIVNQSQKDCEYHKRITKRTQILLKNPKNTNIIEESRKKAKVIEQSHTHTKKKAKVIEELEKN